MLKLKLILHKDQNQLILHQQHKVYKMIKIL